MNGETTTVQPTWEAGPLAPPDENYCRALLDPWIIRSIPRNSPDGEDLINNEYRKLRRRLRKHNMKSMLGMLKIASVYRTTNFVQDEYERIWSNYNWPNADADYDEKPTYATWKGEVLVLKKGGLNRMELDRIGAAIRHIEPQSVLEIGSGSGINSLALCGMFPDIHFAGVELAEAGCQLSKSVQLEPTLPEVIAKFSPGPVVDHSAHRRIDFRQGDAARLPFADNEFDLVFSRLALEQMELIRDDVLSEIRRVARRAAIFLEPFADCNQTEILKLATRAKKYFSLPINSLNDYGLTPTNYFCDWPQKVKEGCGLVIAIPA